MKLEDKSLRLTPKRIEALHTLGIADTEGLLSYYPFRYEVLNAKPFSDWKLKEKVAFEGEVVSAVRSFHFGRSRTCSSFDVMTEDRVLHVTIFNRPWAKQLQLNQKITVTGIYAGGQKVTAISYQQKSLAEIDEVTPVYSVRAGIQQRTIRECISRALLAAKQDQQDLIPEHLISSYQLLHRAQALRQLHQPAGMEGVTSAYRTMKYEEFLKFFLAVGLLKEETVTAVSKQPRKFDHLKIEKMLKGLPYELTKDQRKAIDEILQDMESSRPMYRLVQGDVGCGKTLVAAAALYACALAGYQGALLAPTEILARQHFESLQALMAPLGLHIAVLYAGISAEETAQILEDTASGRIDILIGTHSLLSERVHFKRLGLVAADEQQRFGVAQRRALRDKGEQVDFLLMSATPIPRTLASTLYGDMDISTIETMPAGRKPVITKLIRENSFRSVLEDVRGLLAGGHQLYVICAAVEENDAYEARSAVKTAASLSKLFAPEYQVGVLHGRMSSQEKQDIMTRFAENRIQVLVSTTVVEVGMNVVNATGMIVYDADRFGISQLHQLRGRIQRGSEQGQCWLLTGSEDASALERLEVLVRSANGFEISYEDLRLRGPGDILGTRQSGAPDFVLGNPVEDTRIITRARADAVMILENRKNREYQDILAWVQRRNSRNASYAD